MTDKKQQPSAPRISKADAEADFKAFSEATDKLVADFVGTFVKRAAELFAKSDGSGGRELAKDLWAAYCEHRLQDAVAALYQVGYTDEAQELVPFVLKAFRSRGFDLCSTVALVAAHACNTRVARLRLCEGDVVNVFDAVSAARRASGKELCDGTPVAKWRRADNKDCCWVEATAESPYIDRELTGGYNFCVDLDPSLPLPPSDSDDDD
jgi:hypothetical protein